MNYIHILLHIKPVASRAAVYLAAVIGAEAEQNPVPAPLLFDRVIYLRKYGYIGF